jgi:TRAP-type C4-dicarboxylate transport system permease large subunit
MRPPVGSVLLVGCAVGKVRIEVVMKGIWRSMP